MTWYYKVEMRPGEFMPGQFPDDLPFLPRMMLRGADVEGMECLDIGTMEGMIPVLLNRRGARVTATDFSGHVYDRVRAVREAYDAKFTFAQTGPLYNIADVIRGQYDLINLSGVLYHVYSPLMVLAAVRPLLKRNGLMFVSTNVVMNNQHGAYFNSGGRFQSEPNTFWYLGMRLLDYMLRLYRLEPIARAYWEHDEFDVVPENGMETAYQTVVCRAVDEPIGGEYAEQVAQNSWEFASLTDWNRVNAAGQSKITFENDLRHTKVGPVGLSDSHVLRLEDQS